MQNNAGAQNNADAQNNAGTQSSASAQNNTSTHQVPQNQKKVTMAGPKEKLPKFNGDGTANPIKHCKTCETIWMANDVTNQDD